MTAMDIGAAASHMRRWLSCQVVVVLGALSLLAACGKEAPKPAPAPLEVSIVTVKPGNIDISREYVAQTQSSQAVNIQARVSGWLDKRVYTEGAVVKDGPGDVPDGPEAVPGAAGRGQGRARSASRPRCTVAQQNLDRTKPLAQQNALSQKDLDDAHGPVRAGRRGGASRRRRSSTPAQLNLSYTTIRSPVDGVVELRAGGRRHLPQPAERAAHDGVGADADVGQLQHLGKRDGAHPQRRARRPAQSCPKAASSTSKSWRWSTAISSRTRGADHVRRSVVQPHDRHVPDARDGGQSRRACCAPTSTCACG